MLTPSHVRDAYLHVVINEMLDEYPKATMMIFVGKCRNAEILRITLQELDIDCVALHSKLRQGQRLGGLERFRGGKVRVLIATDVGSR